MKSQQDMQSLAVPSQLTKIALNLNKRNYVFSQKNQIPTD